MATNAGAGLKPLVFQIRLLVEPDETGFHAWIPMLNGLHANGDSIEEARKHACELAIDYLETLVEDGDPIPIGPQIKSDADIELPDSATEIVIDVPLILDFTKTGLIRGLGINKSLDPGSPPVQARGRLGNG